MKLPTEIGGGYDYINTYIHHSIREHMITAIYESSFNELRARWLITPGDNVLIEAIENETEEGKALWLEILKRRITE